VVIIPYRFEIQNQRRASVIAEGCGRKQCSLNTVSDAVPQDPTRRPARRAVRLRVVLDFLIQKRLNFFRL